MTTTVRENFLRATDSREMRPFFERNLERIAGTGTILRSLYITRVFLRKDGGLSVQYEINFASEGNDKRLILWGILSGSDTIPVEVNPGQEAKAITFDDLGLIIPIFPYDTKLKRLSEYFGTGKPAKEMLAMIPRLHGGDFEITNCSVLGYRINRRCVLKYTVAIKSNGTTEELEIAAKISRPGKNESSIVTAEKLQQSGFTADSPDGLTIPDHYYGSVEQGAVYSEMAPGRSIHEISGGKDYVNACFKAGEILRKFRGTQLDHLNPYTADDELKSLREKASAVSELFPEIAKSISEIAGILEKRIPRENIRFKLAHRDFYDKQVLIAPGRTTLLDFDNAAYSDPALDYANFLAHLTLRAYQHPEITGDLKQASEAFAGGYGEIDSNFAERAGWWKAASLARIAVLYTLRPRWRSIVTNILKDVNEILGENRVLSGENL